MSDLTRVSTRNIILSPGQSATFDGDLGEWMIDRMDDGSYRISHLGLKNDQHGLIKSDFTATGSSSAEVVDKMIEHMIRTPQ